MGLVAMRVCGHNAAQVSAQETGVMRLDVMERARTWGTRQRATHIFHIQFSLISAISATLTSGVNLKQGSTATLTGLPVPPFIVVPYKALVLPNAEIQRTAAVRRTLKLVKDLYRPPLPPLFWRLQPHRLVTASRNTSCRASQTPSHTRRSHPWFPENCAI